MNRSAGKLAFQWFATRESRAKRPALTRLEEKRSSPSLNLYTLQEDELIRKSYSADGSHKLAERLGRSYRSIQARASVLGVSA